MENVISKPGMANYRVVGLMSCSPSNFRIVLRTSVGVENARQPIPEARATSTCLSLWYSQKLRLIQCSPGQDRTPIFKRNQRDETKFILAARCIFESANVGRNLFKTPEGR